jgi:hypothetical protein
MHAAAAAPVAAQQSKLLQLLKLARTAAAAVPSLATYALTMQRARPPLMQ